MADSQGSEKKGYVPVPDSLRDSFDSAENHVEETFLARSLRPRRASTYTGLVAFGHLAFAMLYSICLYLILSSKVKSQVQSINSLILDPAQDFLKYEVRTYSKLPALSDVDHTPYGGYPRQALDDNWDELLAGSNLRIGEEEWKDISHHSDGIQLPDGGYFSSIVFYHQLHCLKRLHHQLYADQYFPNMTEKEKESHLWHSEHCLDTIRQGILCKPDTSFRPFRWSENSPIPVEDGANEHTCVNWDSLKSWVQNRSVDPFKPGYLMHPKFGWPYEPGNIDRARVGVDVGFS